MSEGWRRWWSARTEREQRLLLVMCALVAALLVWMLVVRPLADALDSAKARHAAAVDAVGAARARAAAAPEAGGSRTPPRPLDAFVRRTAAEAGFVDAGISAQGGGRVSIAIAAARPQAFFAWVRQVEARGLAVESLTARANQDRTLAIEAGFRARGGG